MLVIEADIHEYVGMSYVDKNILGPLVHMRACVCVCMHVCVRCVYACMYACVHVCVHVFVFLCAPNAFSITDSHNTKVYSSYLRNTN